MANIFQQVQTYQKSSLALLINQNPWIYTANKEFKNFDTFTGNLGSTVTFDQPPRLVVNDTLVATFQDTEQRVLSLTVDQAKNVAFEFSSQDWIFNAEQYINKYGRTAVTALGTVIGASIAQNAVTNTYRTFGDGITPIDSYTQYAQALADYRAVGAPDANAKVYVSDVDMPGTIANGLGQFVPERNEEIAHSWMLGTFSDASFCRSNMLPVHIAGTAGVAQDILTVDALDVTGTLLTLSNVATDLGAFAENDIITIDFVGNLAPTPLVRFTTSSGYLPSSQRIQVRVTAAADAVAGVATVSIFPAINFTVGDKNQNATVTPVGSLALTTQSHRAGLITSNSPLFLAMPQLPDQTPFHTANSYDENSGGSMRMYYGTKFGENQQGFVYDTIWGSTLASDYAMRIAYPL